VRAYPIKLRFRWDGELPRAGDFLKAPRGRTAYEITAIKLGDRGTDQAGERVRPQAFSGVFTVCRWEPKEVPSHARIHPWQWDKR
jgi:hypothetical protein